MKFGISLSSLGSNELEPQLERALQLKQRHGLDHVEVSMTNLTGDPSILWPWDYSERTIRLMRDFLGHFESSGVHLPFAYIFLTCPNPRIRAEGIRQMEQGIDVSAELKLDYTVTHTKTGPREPGEMELEVDRFAEVFAGLAERAERHNLVFTVENGSDVGMHLDHVARIVKAVDRPGLAITFDTGHANFLDATRAYGSHAGFIREEGRLIRNLHIHDNHTRTDEHLPMGRGNIDFAGVLAALVEMDYGGAFTLEYMGDLEGQIDANIEDARRLVENARHA